MGGENIVESYTMTNKSCVSLTGLDSTDITIKAEKKGTSTLTLVTKGDNKKYTVNITVVDPLKLTVTNVTRKTVNGKATLNFTLRNDSKHAISTSKKTGAIGDSYGLSIYPLKSDATIQPGKSKTLTILTELSVKTYGKNVLSGMSPGLNVKYEGHVYAVWFDKNGGEIQSIYLNPFKFMEY
ncbi:hypothetical protein [Anaerosporobacter sp.]|uniref:hypothetical protein n=1 Tax=Anaerosporobacter sp. TaxID=1872529 RepID=UPI00286EC981|nr:hypothetical protein [Anaerosporobacter sp.]